MAALADVVNVKVDEIRARAFDKGKDERVDLNESTALFDEG